MLFPSEGRGTERLQLSIKAAASRKQAVAPVRLQIGNFVASWLGVSLNPLLPPLPPSLGSPVPLQKHGNDWKPEIRIPNNSEYVVLSGLDWDTEYEVHVVAENGQGKSEPGVLSFRTSTEPSTMPGKPLPP